MGRIVVTGMGSVSAIGTSVAQHHTALLQGKSGLHTLQQFPSRYSAMPFGEVKLDNATLKEKLVVTSAGVTRTSLLALHAFNEAIQDAGLTPTQIADVGTALIGATTVGGMCLTDELYNDGNALGTPSIYLSSYDFASVSMFLQQHNNMTGIVNTINTACSSSANAIMYGARLIQNGFAKRAIVGGAESLSKFIINGFNALRILSPQPCRPFDAGRQGLNLGEGSAFLVLEKEEDVKERKAYAVLSGYFNANDAYHPSALSDQGEGPYLSMKGALQHAGLAPGDIDFINVHGTGTENNDEVESKAMLRLFDEIPPFQSTKSYTGHTLGAASAIEAVCAILNLTNNEVYASLNFDTAIPVTNLVPVLTYSKKNIKHVMSNSFGFGGNCTSLIFSKA